MQVGPKDPIYVIMLKRKKVKYLLNKRPEIFSICQHKNKFQVKTTYKKKGMHAIWTSGRPNTPTW